MGRKMKGKLALGMGFALLLLTAAVAATGTGTSCEDVRTFNLADLVDGESRTFGEGDHAMTAARRGDEVTVTFRGNDGEHKTLRCTVGKDSCYAMTVSDNGKIVTVVLDRSRSTGDEKLADRIVLGDGSCQGKGVLVFSSDGNPAGHQVVIQADSADAHWISEDDAGATADVNVIRIREEGTSLLRCPQGDATLTLKKGEENSGPYFCPKHNVQMEKVEGPVIIKKVDVQTRGKKGDK